MQAINPQLLKKKLNSTLKGADILLIVPPFSRSCKGAMLEPHSLQALAREQGFQVEVLYLNVLLASLLGVELSEEISNTPRYSLMGDRLFSRSAYGLPPLGKSAESSFNEAISTEGRENRQQVFDKTKEFDLTKYLKIEALCFDFMETVIPMVAALNYKIVGCVLGWYQTNCSITVINRIKQISPTSITFIGGLHCEDEMAEGIASLSEATDYVLSGEIESAFMLFLRGYSAGNLPQERVLVAPPVTDLDQLPLPDYHNFFEQVEPFLGEDLPQQLLVAYETSRGCWKGQKKRCHFCGLNSNERIGYRHKTVEKVARELKELGDRYPDKILYMPDHILPSSYYSKLLPLLDLPQDFSIRVFESPLNCKLKNLIRLRDAKINKLQPGIEGLSTGLLNLMNKGLSAKQNLLFLRNALSSGIRLHWFMLWGVPGDQVIDYEQTLKLMPLIRHLEPPAIFTPVRFERFSSYVQAPKHYQISNLRPWQAYQMVYPEHADVEKLAYYFIGDFPSEAYEQPDIIRAINSELKIWQSSWKKAVLELVPFMGQYFIRDSRQIEGGTKTHVLTGQQVRAVMQIDTFQETKEQEWAVEEKLAVVVDSWYVPLVTASPEFLLDFEDHKTKVR